MYQGYPGLPRLIDMQEPGDLIGVDLGIRRLATPSEGHIIQMA